MKKVCVVGHFGFGENMLNGQTIKTKTVTTELEKQLGADQVMKIDTHGGAKALPKIIVQLISAFNNCKNIIIFPAHNGIKVFVPLCNAINRVFHRKLHYVVIGGWLNELLDEHKKIEVELKAFTGIYVETNAMKSALCNRGFYNVEVMPNFKDIKILSEDELVYNTEMPYKLCTFSRVMKEKGIEEAVEAVKQVNMEQDRLVFTLDIYGQIDSEQIEWFEKLKSRFPVFVKYKGIVPYDKSVDTIKDYYALLFPTYYEGEGFAGTLLDAMAAGVPVIASDWKYNSEIVLNKINGLLIKESLVETLNMARIDNLLWMNMKKNCLSEAIKYLPRNAIKTLVNLLEED